MTGGSVRRHRVAALAILAAATFFLLAIPTRVPPAPPGPVSRAFAWNQNERWEALEQRFRDARTTGCETLDARIGERFAAASAVLDHLQAQPVGPSTAVLDSIEDHVFELGPMVAACFAHLPAYVELVTRLRAVVKRQSETWDIGSRTARDRLYRLLYGGRMALEEVMLQGPPESLPPLVPAEDEPSTTPFTRVLGVTVHSGDLLVSRGGAPTSALIAVGNDYPGHFSHVAIVHVDAQTSLASVIQSSQDGLHVSTLDDYLGDIKLRVMVLRVRADLPTVVADPLLPHRAAAWALKDARTRHVPYDFNIDHRDGSKLYCSEVPARAYAAFGVELWMSMSRISDPRTRAWLSALGVTQFEAQEPSDLEYDPQLRVVAEWRDPETLFMDHVDAVAIEAMLADTTGGIPLDAPWYLLPGVRIAKGYSMILNLLGRAGPVPEGLNATLATRVLRFNQRHRAIRAAVVADAKAFVQVEGYRPPEWELLAMARRANANLR